MNLPEVFFVNPNGLKYHPLLDLVPELDEGDPQFQAILASVRERGVDYPVIVDEDDRLMDGRNRVRAAARSGAELPAMRRSSREAPEIILASMVNRRHLPKGALAYLSVPLFDPAIEAGRQRALANLNQGAKPRNPIQSGVGKTVEQLAAQLGFSPDLYEQAVKVRRLFGNRRAQKWHDGARDIEATYQAWFEPKILSGEIGLGGVIQAIAGKEATEGKTPGRRGLIELLGQGLDLLKKRFERWETLPPKQRHEFTREMAHDAAAWPEDVRNAVLAALEKAATQRGPKPSF